ncbi:hypothetical protein [Cytophaga sp. FL35]|uniref:hypothetical protein n=1 Tax=Cytophaga sp. FL35 TaxID=1904456 RepID=UPI0016535E6E|nr:hypothetical protein [Cytophaga sp. FL35]MBC7000018.1 hypothetical protein [Cytophaga sp. FL35]
MDNAVKRPSTVFWVIAVLAVLWNLVGVLSYLADAFMSLDDLAQLPEDQQKLYAVRPAWVTGAFAIAVWAGLLGSIALLFRKKWAKTLYIISFLGVIVQNVYQFFLSNTFEVFGKSAMVFPVIIIIISILLVLYSKKLHEKGILS